MKPPYSSWLSTLHTPMYGHALHRVPVVDLLGNGAMVLPHKLAKERSIILGYKLCMLLKHCSSHEGHEQHASNQGGTGTWSSTCTTEVKRSALPLPARRRDSDDHSTCRAFWPRS